jgi:hypothetical protein
MSREQMVRYVGGLLGTLDPLRMTYEQKAEYIVARMEELQMLPVTTPTNNVEEKEVNSAS